MNETGETPSFWRLAARSKRLQTGATYASALLVLACLMLLAAFVAEAASARLAFGLIGALLVVFGAMCLRGGIREIREWRRLAREGILGQGVVTAVQQTREDVFPLWLSLVLALLPTRNIPAVQGWVISYGYEANGTRYSGESGLLRRVEAEKWTVGATCMIRYDVKHPAKSVWIGNASGPGRPVGEDAVGRGRRS